MPCRRSLPAESTVNEFVALAPSWLQAELRGEVLRELRAEAAGLVRRPSPRASRLRKGAHAHAQTYLDRSLVDK